MVEQQRSRKPRQTRRPRQRSNRPTREELLEDWKPGTELGVKVKAGEITSLDQIYEAGHRIMEAEIVDMLVSDLYSELLLIGQAKGKFGGGKRRIFRQTQKKTKEGNTIKFTTCAVVGNKNGYVGIAFGKSGETVPARDKASKAAKLNLIKVRRGCGSWEGEADANSIPFAVTGKCGSSELTLFPAPKGTGLCVEKECAKILEAAGIKDVWSKTKGQTKTKVNLVQACMDALRNLSAMKVQERHVQALGVVEGAIASNKKIIDESVAIPAEEVKASQ